NALTAIIAGGECLPDPYQYRRACSVVGSVQQAGLATAAEKLADQRLSLLRNLKSVGVQVQKYRFGDMRALLWRDPIIVQIRTAIALGVFDKSRMNGVRNQFFYRVSRHIAS